MKKSLADSLVEFTDELQQMRWLSDAVKARAGRSAMVLSILTTLEAEEPKTKKQLCDATLLHWHVITGALQALRKQELVIDTPSGIEITPKGREVLAEAVRRFE